MEKEQIYLLMEIVIQEVILMEKQTGKEFINGKMVVYIQENSKKE